MEDQEFVKKIRQPIKNKKSNKKNFENMAVKNHKFKKQNLKDEDYDEEYDEYSKYIFK